MNVYKCDSCGKIIENSYEEKMKEFYISTTIDFFYISHPDTITHEVEIHLCKDCFYNLHKIQKIRLKKRIRYNEMPI